MFSHAYFTMTVRRLFSDNRNQPKSNYPPRTLGSSASRILKMLDGSHYGVQADAHERKMLRLWIERGRPIRARTPRLGCGSIGGYLENKQVNADWDWPTTRDGAEVIARRCASCHQGTREPSAVAFRRARRIVLAVRPERSTAEDEPSHRVQSDAAREIAVALGPAGRSGGRVRTCAATSKASRPPCSPMRHDPDYEKLLAMITAGKRSLAAIKRFDMPGFRPCEPYLREMKHYGILPADHRG